MDDWGGVGVSASRPWVRGAGEAVGIAGAIEALVMRADGGADRGEPIDKRGERLAVDRMLAQQCAIDFRALRRPVKETVHELAIEADEADVVQPRAGHEHVLFLRSG